MLAYYYFDFTLRENHSRDCLASLVLQFASRSEAAHKRLVAFHTDNHKHHEKPNEMMLYQFLKDILSDSQDICIILDGLDEWSDDPEMDHQRRQLALPSLLKYLKSLGLNGARLLLTSRPEQDIRDCLKDLSPTELDLNAAQEQLQTLKDFIKREFDGSRSGYRDWSQEDKDKVSGILFEKWNGM